MAVFPAVVHNMIVEAGQACLKADTRAKKSSALIDLEHAIERAMQSVPHMFREEAHKEAERRRKERDEQAV